MTNKGIEFPHRKTTHAEKLQYLLSCRMRLSEDQRTTLKKAWNAYRDAHKAAAQPPIGGSTVKTVTTTAAPALLGMSDLIITDLISTRESIALLHIVNLQAALGCEVVGKQAIRDQLEHYLDWIWSQASNHLSD